MCALRAAITGKVYDTDQYWTDEMAYENDPDGVDAQTAASVAVDPGWKIKTGEVTNGIRETADAILWIYPNNGKDMKDSMNAAIIQFQSPCAVGFIWYSSWNNTVNGIVPEGTPLNALGGHLTMFGGDNLAFGADIEDNQGSWGVDAPGSVQGHYGFPRSIINGYVEGYPCFIPFNSNNALTKWLGTMSAYWVRMADLLNTQSDGVYPPVSQIQNLVAGVIDAEGHGTQGGMKYNNPGDIRGKIGNKYQASLGVTGYGENNLAIFPDMATGEKAIAQICTDVANNQLLGYPKPCNISQFAKEYGDPLTQQEWDDYVAVLLKHLTNCNQNTQIKNLL
jgi:hypothetical protein